MVMVKCPSGDWVTSGAPCPPPKPAIVVDKPPGPPPPERQQPNRVFHIFVEGVEVATANTPEKAAKAATKNSERGQRVEVFHALPGDELESTGLGIRSSAGIEPVPPEIESQVRTMTPDQVRAAVDEAERKRKPDAPFPWVIVGGAAAAAALLL